MRELTLDALGRPLGTLRLSVTDRCNLRCSYCMPEDDYQWLPRAALLDFDELARLARVFARLGARRVRLTGGEPLLRRDLPRLVEKLATAPEIDEVALTSNGVLLAELARPLAGAGLARITVSLDTLRAERFRELTRQDDLDRVLAGIAAARAAGLALKLDTVVLRGVNDDEIAALLGFAASAAAELRFIEYMDVGGATRWRQELVVSRAEILAAVARELGPVAEIPGRGASPAESFEVGGQRFGVIASMTAPFCRACDRSRVTADGMWLHCLYATAGFDLKRPLRAGASDEELARIVADRWQARADRGAELRSALAARDPLVPVSALRRDPHLEMHTRGG